MINIFFKYLFYYILKINRIYQFIFSKLIYKKKLFFIIIMELVVTLAIVFGAVLFLLGLACCICGFTPVGIAAHSVAACCQSIIGNVVKGSCFAIMTCLAMRGCFILILVLGLLVMFSVGIYLMINSEWFQSICIYIINNFSSSAVKSVKGFLHR